MKPRVGVPAGTRVPTSSVTLAWRPRLRAVALVTLLAGLLAVGPTVEAAATGARSTPSAPHLTEPRPCPGSPGFTCWTLRVPLDHTGKVPGELRLQVAAAHNLAAPKGVLLFLPGGPGLAGVPLVGSVAQRLPGLARNYRLVMFDQRGTGELGALNCPQMHREVVSSDVAAQTPEAIRECGDIVGPARRFYRTDDMVADLEVLRRALGVRKLTIDGVSYGSLTAARYVRHAARFPVATGILPRISPGWSASGATG